MTEKIIIYTGFLALYYYYLIFRSSQGTVKKFATFNLIGSIISVLLPLIGALWLQSHIPGNNMLFLSIGTIITTYSFEKCPKLAYVLPFNVSQLHVFESNSGLPVFTHLWEESKHKTSPRLFSSMMQGVTLIMNESLGKGKIREIKFESGVLILQYNQKYKLGFVISSSSSSIVLYNALKSFSREFIKKYRNMLERKNKDYSVFKTAEKLVDKYLFFIPK